MDFVRLFASIAVALALGAALALLFALEPRPLDRSDPALPKKRKGLRLRAVLACAGPRASARIHRYSGFSDCRIAHSIYNGDRACVDSCIGYGTCRDLCPIGAIVSAPDGTPRISEDCDGCGLCVRECPSGALKLVRSSADVYVRCVSRFEPGSARSAFCPSACTACGACERAAPGAGFSIRNGIAHIDYSAKGDRRPAVSACPSSCIAPISADERGKNAFQGDDNGLEWKNRAHGSMDAK